MKLPLAVIAPTLVVIASVSPLRWLWPYMIEWYGFPIMLLWFYGTIHCAMKAVLWALDE